MGRKKQASLTMIIHVLFLLVVFGNVVKAQCLDIVPEPQNFTCGDKNFSIDSSWQIIYDQNLKYVDNTLNILNSTIVNNLNLYLQFKDKDQFATDYVGISNHESSNIFLLLYDDPLVKDYFASQDSQIFNLSGRVGNKGFGQAYLLFTYKDSIYVLADFSQGVYYGMQSLRQIIEAQSDSISEFDISDWPDIEYRIYYYVGHEDPADITDPSIGLQYLEGISKYKMNGVHLGSGSMLQHMNNMFIPYVDFSVRNFIRPILGQSMPNDIERGVEGFFVENESFTFDANDVAIPDNPGTDVLMNLDFENGNAGEVPENWRTSSTSPENGEWLITDQEHYSGSKALMLSRDSSSGSSRPMIYQVGDITPDSYYFASFRVKTEGSSGTGHYQFLLYFYDIDNNYLFYRENDYKPIDDGNWHTINIHISGNQDARKLRLWIRPRNIYGTIYVDDIKLFRMNAKMSNVLLQDEHLFRITDLSGNVEYSRGSDYSISKTGPDLTQRSHIKEFTNNITISRIPTGNIEENENVLISFDYLFYQDKSTTSNDNPFVDYNYDLVEQYLSNLATEFNDNGFSPDEIDVFLGQDEIRGFNMDSRSIQAGKENYEAMAIHLNRLYELTKGPFPNSRVFFWADMLNYYHNGITEDYQIRWGGKSGATYQASYLINKSVIMIPWWYRNSDSMKTIRESGNFFNNIGIRIAGGAGGNLDNIKYWSAILNNTNNYFYGHSIFSAEYSKGEIIRYFANYSWNAYKGDIAGITEDGEFELCNGNDDDGDGMTDEDYDFLTDINHCGSCGNVCYMPNAISSCVNGNCNYKGSPDTVALYHFDEDSGTIVIDSSGNGNDGTVHEATRTSDSVSGNALRFDGNNDYVSIADSLSMDFDKSSGTIELWVKLVNPVSGAFQPLAIDSNFEIEFDIQGDGDLFYYPYADHDTWNNYNLVTNPLTAGKWQQVAVTWEYSTKDVRIYVNGAEQTPSIENVPTYWTTLASTGDWHVGGSPVKNQFFNGTIDEVSIYDRALTAEEISDHYNELSGHIRADLNDDGVVDILDLGIVAIDFGKTSGFDPRADTDSNGLVDIFDIVFVASRFT